VSSAIFHPDLLRHLARDRFGSAGEVQHRTVTQDSFGEEVITYALDPLLQQIACQVQPHTTRGDSEVRRPNDTVVMEPFDILLAGYYPTINEQDRLIVWPRQDVHNILKVAHDDSRAYTTLVTEIVSG